MPNIFTTGLFKSPKFSVFPCKHTNKLSCGIGKNVPVAYEQLGPGDRYVSDIGQLTRFAPLAAPTMDEFEVTYDTFFVPFRIMNPKGHLQFMDDYESFDNYYENVDGNTRLNAVVESNYLFAHTLERAIYRPFSIKQSLYDFLGYPMYDNYRRLFRESLSSGASNQLRALIDAELETEPYSYTRKTVDMYYLPTTYSELYYMVKDIAHVQSDDSQDFVNPFNNLPVYDSNESTFYRPTLSFLSYIGNLLVRQFSPSVENWEDYLNYAQVNLEPFVDEVFEIFEKIGFIPASNSITPNFTLDWNKVWDALGIHEDDCLKSYFDAVTAFGLLGLDSDDTTEQFLNSLPSREVNFLPLYAYKRVVADWYLNQLALPVGTPDGEAWYASEVNLDISRGQNFDWSCSNRQWANDYFTSVFPSPQAGQSVLIPVNGTMQDLRASNSLIRFKERLMYAGKKIKDQLYAIFGVHSSDARLDMAEVIKREVFNLNIQTITQVSAGDTPLATLAGNGVSAGARHLVDYIAEEAGIIMTIMSVRPRASYFQGVRRLLTKRDLTEFLIPDFANVGAQQIDNSEIYLDYNSSIPSGMFGYTRKYAEYMFENSEVHGSFRDDLDFWHAARQFTSQPRFGTDFMSVDAERDNLNRIFAVRGDENIYCYLFFDNKVVRPLPKYVQYSW